MCEREPQVKSLFVAVLAQLGQPFFGGTGTVAADQDRLSVEFGVGDLADRLIGEPEVVGGVIRPGIARPQHPGQRLVGVVQPYQQRVIA